MRNASGGGAMRHGLALGAVFAAFALGAVLAALALAAACLYEPPGQLPSSIRLLYSRTTRDSLGTHVDVYFLVAREGNELRLTGEAGDDRQPAFAPGLRKVFFTRRAEGRDEIWSMDLDGSQEEVALAAPDADYRDPAISSDETRIAYTRATGVRHELWVADIDGENPRPLLSEGGPWRQPAWSPDGGTIAVVGGPEGSARIHVINADGGPSRPLLTTEGEPQSEPAWSPDGRRVAFVRGTGRSAEIVVAEVASGQVDRLTDNDVPDASPSWSPDGERIAFVSRRPHERDNLWLIDVDGENAAALTRHESSDARDPDWL